MKKIKWPGHGWKFLCHRCGFQYPSTEIKKEWTGLLVCGSCWEPRHPQTLIKVTGEKAFPDIISKEPAVDVFQGVCDVASSSGYSDLGETDCMKVDNNAIAYSFLKDLFKNGHGDM